MQISWSYDEIEIQVEPVTEAQHEIEKKYLHGFRKAVVESSVDPSDGKTWRLVIKASNGQPE